MKLLVTLLLITLLVGCGREELLSPYEYESYIDAEAQSVLNKIKLMDKDESLSKKEKCKGAREEILRFRNDVMKVLNLKSIGEPYIIEKYTTPEGAARRKAIDLFVKYHDVFREFLWMKGC